MGQISPASTHFKSLERVANTTVDNPNTNPNPNPIPCFTNNNPSVGARRSPTK